MVITKTMKIILAVTLALFFVCGVALGISLTVEYLGDSGSVYLGSGGSGGGAAKDTPSVPVGDFSSGEGKQTGIKLPCATAEGVYKSTSSTSKITLTDDSVILSKAAILVELTGNTSIVERSADTPIHPASLTKVMTILVACENAKDPNAMMTVTQEMVDYHAQTGGSGSMAFVAGESISVEDALYLINYNSDTVACLLIANYVSQNEDEFVKLMNQKAASLGLTNTNFVNCTGLENENHKTTCREMAAIMYAAMKNETAKKIITSYNAYEPVIYKSDGTSRTELAYSSWYSVRLKDNNWAGNGSDVKIYGGKTGSEDTPSSCFVTYAQNTKTNVEYICVTIGKITSEQTNVTNSKSTEDTKKLYQLYAKTEKE